MRLRTILGFIMCYNQPSIKDIYNKLHLDIAEIFKDKQYKCPRCVGIINIDEIDYSRHIYEYSGIKCYKCNEVIGYY
jgi:hypothetical protein